MKFNSEELAIKALIELALSEVGYIEKKTDSFLYDKKANIGDNNYTKYGKEMYNIYPDTMDLHAPWCDCFVDWCFYKTFEISNAKNMLCGDFDDYTVRSAQLYKNKKAWYASNPKIGDQIFFSNNVRIYHTGIVYDVDKKYVYTVEGNTSNSEAIEPNGGMVCRKKYLLSNSRIAGYGRPLYSLAVDKNNLITHRITVGESGLVVSTDSTLNVRDYPKTGKIISIVKNGKHIYPTLKTFIENEPWYYIPELKGWISAKYVENGWVHEDDIFGVLKWWYIHKGYTCTSNNVENINGVNYLFNKDGYMYENTEICLKINENGVISL